MAALFGKKPEKPQAVRMPVDNDASVKSAEERQRRAIAARGGRSSTILSRQGGTAGTTAYKNSLLGQAG